MPELPEVETVIRGLRHGIDGSPGILGQEITGASLFWHKTLANSSFEAAQSLLAGQKVSKIGRKAKYILIQLDKLVLIIHLRMSGDLRLALKLGEPRTSDPLLAHDRFYLHFSSAWGLAFNDPRKFGRIWLTKDPSAILPRLGPDPFDPKLDAGCFYQMLQSKARQIKPLLMDQAFLGGIGNIYSTEALFEAKLHPLQNSRYITFKEAETLLSALRSVLQAGIEHNGTSVDWVYKGGDFQKYLKAYQKTGQPCPDCNTAIEAIRMGQRNAHFCPRCQQIHT